MLSNSSIKKAMPVAFLAHGSPMNALENNYFTEDWHTLCKGIPTPKAIVIFSAHWHVPGTIIQNQTTPQTLHDFGGFPQALFNCQYPAIGAPDLAEQLCTTLNNSGFAASHQDTWGLDHGSWVLLKHLYPNADIPCLQISLDSSNNDLKHHFKLAQSLKQFREQGVLFIGSGNIVHNISKWIASRPSDPISWARDFDHEIFKAIEQRCFDRIFDYQTLPYAQDAVPTIEHFLPLIYILGLSGSNDEVLSSEFDFQDLSTACSRSIVFQNPA